MAMTTHPESGRESARDIAVWDPLVRLIHWSLALTILLNGALVEEESKLHEWIGYVALALVVLRLVWGIVGPRHARFSAFPPSPMGAIRHIRSILVGDRIVHLSHNPIGALMVYNLWLTVIVLGATGYMMTTLQFFGVDWVEEAHEFAFGWLLFSVALHVAGIAFETWRSGVNLVRSMVSGRKNIPDGSTLE